MTIKVIIRPVLLYITILLFISAPAQKIKTSEIATYVNSLSKTHQLSAVVIASYKGKVIYEKAVGYAEAEFNLPNQLNTRFCIASVTKSMTRIIALKLVEEGTLRLQDKLSKWVHGFPGGDQITVGMLLDHRSGLPHRITRPEEETITLHTHRYA
ncbi:MAG: serine hydrolase domain-containing protein [Bacteroidota bacterium]